ncbi:MAG: Flp pilus assembly complex ATPase component TadA [Bdellovibrionales bacterium]|nr:Flp pilus assembly complex ATPase component TadA [Bdellovibrionales bacterium]
MAAGKLGDLLVKKGVVSREQIAEATAYSRQNRVRLGSALIQLGHVNENVFASFVAKLYGLTAVSLDGLSVSSDILELVPRSLAEKHTLVPISIEGSSLTVAMADPSNVAAVDDIRFLSNMDVVIHIAGENAIISAINRIYGTNDADPGQKIASKFGEGSGPENTGQIEVGKLDEAHEVEGEGIGEKPIIKLINTLFMEAIRRKSSDIHIEPYNEFSRVRFRIDGSLHEVMRIPQAMRTAVPSRIKVMAHLDISEKRLPQDGRIQVKTKRRKIDVRVSTIPTIFGEKVVMRLLDQGESTPSLLGVGFEESQYQAFKLAASQPYGMVLVTGPTGSGKSTTLYAALSELNGPDVNISTVEDPVEYKMAGINQVQMKEGIGLNFASALRSLLRQDPDIIMVGEIRDQETAEIAVKAALTGHMVFSTLHTNDAPSTINRLLHMGLEPFLITAALTLVQAQRLLRINCPNCIQDDNSITPEQLIAAEMPKNWIQTFKAKKGVGCERCGNTGYKGRKGVFEVMPMTEKLRTLVVKKASSDEIKRQAIRDGMITLRQSAMVKLYRGETTFEEVLNNTRPDGDLKS